MNRDGEPHFTYYDRERLLSYVWDGASKVIEVSRGGYGEPVIARIPTREDMHSAQTPAMALAHFVACIKSEDNPFNIDLEAYGL